MKLIFIALLLATCTFAESERMAFLDLTYSYVSDHQCKLIERGSAIKKEYFEIKGELGDAWCAVKLSRTEVDKYFKFCALAGYNSWHSESGRCLVQSNREGGLTFIAMDRNPVDSNGFKTGYRQCDFVCLTKVEGNMTNP
jgi:hypothetical protein